MKTLWTNLRYAWFWLFATKEERALLMSPRAFRKKYIEPAMQFAATLEPAISPDEEWSKNAKINVRIG